MNIFTVIHQQEKWGGERGRFLLCQSGLSYEPGTLNIRCNLCGGSMLKVLSKVVDEPCHYHLMNEKHRNKNCIWSHLPGPKLC